jgi:hypothetical protein
MRAEQMRVSSFSLQRSYIAWPTSRRYNIDVPELSRFFGIIIRMYFEAMEAHHTPHFHAYYQEEVAVYKIDPVELLAGSLPKRQQRFVEAWAELHQHELLQDWERLQSGHTPLPIAPLK